MGGGDLNLKKSWHPSTLRNIERVWKAEQKHEAEQKKIEQLQRELADERARDEIRHYAEDQGVVRKKDDRLDWMYQGPAALVDREQYLTGRTIDKTFEILEQMEDKNKANEAESAGLTKPGAIFAQSACNVTVDLANKIREDPLFAIRKRETDQKKQLLNNPVKMKQLRELLEQSLQSKGKKKKKNKKHRKRSESNDSDSDEKPNKKKLKKKSHRNDHKEKESHHHKEKESKNERQHQEASSKEDRREKSHSKTPNLTWNGKQYGLIGGHKKETSTIRQSRSRSRSPHKPKFSGPPQIKIEKRSTSKTRNDHINSHHRQAPIKDSKPKKLDPEEAEKRCREMMEDAKKWQHQREKNIRRYKEDDERKDRGNKRGKNDETAPDFIKPLLSKAATDGSVEARIKQKMYNIQRNSAAMDKSFARR